VPSILNHAEVLHGDGSDAEALDLAGLTDMDTFITATGENETNIMSCMLAKHLMTTSNGEHPQYGAQNHFAGEQRGIPGAGRHQRLGYRPEQESAGRQRDS
jgi:hypothetical protein